MDALAAVRRLLMNRRASVTVAFTAASFVLAAAPAARAHALLDHAVPAVGATLTGPPATIELTFSEDVEPAFSSIEVTDAAGAKVESTGKLEHPKESVLALPLPSLPPGQYVVHWKVVSVDTHTTEGTFRFRIGAP
jgi:methionine-rich copper-binding protein CopC